MLLNKRYQVFVSSTYRDLKDARGEVIRALLDLKCFPSAMEFFPSANKPPLEYIERITR